MGHYDDLKRLRSSTRRRDPLGLGQDPEALRLFAREAVRRLRAEGDKRAVEVAVQALDGLERIASDESLSDLRRQFREALAGHPEERAFYLGVVIRVDVHTLPRAKSSASASTPGRGGVAWRTRGLGTGRVRAGELRLRA